jgi:hypothetical protein
MSKKAKSAMKAWALLREDGGFVGRADIDLCTFASRASARDYARLVLTIKARPIRVLVTVEEIQ